MMGTLAHRCVVGRQAELGELNRQFDMVRVGQPRVTVLAGVAGIGKTALVEEFIQQHPAARVLRARGLAWESCVPLAVAEQLLRSGGSAGSDSDSETHTSSLALPTAETVDDTGCTHTQTEPVEVVTGRRLLLRCAQLQADAPVIVLVDDAHWADTASIQALSSALRRATTERILVLLTHQEDPEDANSPEIHDLLTGHHIPVLNLGPLRTDDVREMAARVAGVSLSAPAAYRLTQHAAGNPLHIEQLLREFPPDRWSSTQAYLPAPKALRSQVRQRMRGCGPATRGLVQAAAVLGDTVSFGEAAALGQIPEPVAALDEAIQAKLLLVTTQHDGPHTLCFPSSLVRSAVYGDVQPLHRQRLHETAAVVVSDEAARLMHRVAATPFPDAELAQELDQFAAQRASSGAWSAVANALTQASSLSPDENDREQRLLRAVDALVGAGDLARANTFAAAIQSFPPSAFRDAVLGYLAVALGRSAEAEELLGDAWHRCDTKNEPELGALICQRFVLHSLSRWHGRELVSWALRARNLASQHTPAVIESEAIIGLGMAASGQVAAARDAYANSAARMVSGAQAQRFQMAKGWLLLAQDDPSAARKDLENAVPTAYRKGSLRISLWAQAWLARTEFALGSWDAALQTTDRAIAQLEDSGIELLGPLVHWTAAQIQALRGNWEEANEHLSRTAGTHDYEIMLIPSCLAQAQCAEARADYDTVLRALEPITRLPESDGVDEPGFWPWQDIYANALVQTNRIDEADAFLAPHESRAAQRGHRSTLARLGYVRGRLTGVRGDIDTAKEVFDGALEQLSGIPLMYERARVSFAYGQTLRRAGKRREADLILHNARDIYTTLRATSYVERCDRELKAGGLHTKRSGIDLTQLTAQETAVAKLVAEGRSNKRVAVELYVSVKTVQFHLTRIYTKLGVASRSELAAKFHEDQPHSTPDGDSEG